MPVVMTVSTAKGGVLKTTSSTNIAGSLSLDSKNVLLLDFDPQSNSSDTFGINAEEHEGETLADVLNGEVSLGDCLINVAPHLWLVPGGFELAFLDINAYGTDSPLTILKDVFERESDLISRFDYIVIDTPPSLSISVMNAFNVSDYVLIPFQPEYFGKRSLIRTVETILKARKDYGMKFQIKGVFATLVDSRVKTHKNAIESVREWGERNDIKVFDTIIKRTSLFADVVETEQLPFVLSEKGKKRKYRDTRQWYIDLKGEIIDE